MAMKPYRRAVATTGTYTGRDGQEKKRYQNVGTLFQYDDGGFALKLDAVPVGEGWNGFISFYEIEDKRSDADEAPARQRSSVPIDDDFPI